MWSSTYFVELYLIWIHSPHFYFIWIADETLSHISMKPFTSAGLHTSVRWTQQKAWSRNAQQKPWPVLWIRAARRGSLHIGPVRRQRIFPPFTMRRIVSVTQWFRGSRPDKSDYPRYFLPFPPHPNSIVCACSSCFFATTWHWIMAIRWF